MMPFPRALNGWRCSPIDQNSDVYVRVIEREDYCSESREEVEYWLEKNDGILLGSFVNGEVKGKCYLYDISRGICWLGTTQFEGNNTGNDRVLELLDAAVNIVFYQIGCCEIRIKIAEKNSSLFTALISIGFVLIHQGIWGLKAPDSLIDALCARGREMRRSRATSDFLADVTCTIKALTPEIADISKNAWRQASSLVYSHPGMTNADYLSHCARVLGLYVEWIFEPSSDGVSLAIFHNVLEVCKTGRQQLAMELGDKLIGDVELLTVDRKYQWDPTYKRSYYARLNDAPTYIAQIKIVDKMDNLFVLGRNPDAEVRKKYLAEIETYVIPMAQKTLPHAVRFIERQVHAAQILGHFI